MADDVYVVFPGMPVIFDDLTKAEEFAAKLAVKNESNKATVMCVDREYANNSLTAVNVGVVMHATEKVDNPFTDMQWEED